MTFTGLTTFPHAELRASVHQFATIVRSFLRSCNSDFHFDLSDSTVNHRAGWSVVSRRREAYLHFRGAPEKMSGRIKSEERAGRDEVVTVDEKRNSLTRRAARPDGDISISFSPPLRPSVRPSVVRIEKRGLDPALPPTKLPPRNRPPTSRRDDSAGLLCASGPFRALCRPIARDTRTPLGLSPSPPTRGHAKGIPRSRASRLRAEPINADHVVLILVVVFLSPCESSIEVEGQRRRMTFW